MSYKLQARITFLRRLCAWTAGLFVVEVLALNIGLWVAVAGGGVPVDQALGMVHLPWIGLAVALVMAWIAARASADPLPGILAPDEPANETRLDQGVPGWPAAAPEINAANGLPMAGGVDTLGNPQGISRDFH